jgi:hypothetical protein
MLAIITLLYLFALSFSSSEVNYRQKFIEESSKIIAKAKATETQKSLLRATSSSYMIYNVYFDSACSNLYSTTVFATTSSVPSGCISEDTNSLSYTYSDTVPTFSDGILYT